MMLSLRTPPGGKFRLRGAEGAVWRDKTLDNIERDSIQTEWQYHMVGNYCGWLSSADWQFSEKSAKFNSLPIV